MWVHSPPSSGLSMAGVNRWQQCGRQLCHDHRISHATPPCVALHVPTTTFEIKPVPGKYGVLTFIQGNAVCTVISSVASISHNGGMNPEREAVSRGVKRIGSCDDCLAPTCASKAGLTSILRQHQGRPWQRCQCYYSRS